jgi:UDP-GlcNAc3NAcA epimerase
MKLLTVIGARPQFIKAAAISRIAATRSDMTEILLHTGQHYDENMSQVFFDELEIPRPGYNLGIGSGSHGVQTAEMLAGIEKVLLAEQPDWVLVYGDTNSTLAGALAAVKLHIPVAHVEAGLRSFNRRMPEEINRVLTDHAADLLFAPTTVAVQHLRDEGIAEGKIALVGDVMYDAALYYGRRAEADSKILKRMSMAPKSYILATVHRAENTDNQNRLRVIFEALSQVTDEYPVILPLHPRTRKVLKNLGWWENYAEHIHFIEPVGYLDMVMLEKHARLIVTDSGGVQKEAFFHKVPCVTLRDETEWTELLDLGWNHLAPPLTVKDVVTAIRQGMSEAPPSNAQPYGDGQSAKKILDALMQRSYS